MINFQAHPCKLVVLVYYIAIYFTVANGAALKPEFSANFNNSSHNNLQLNQRSLPHVGDALYLNSESIILPSEQDERTLEGAIASYSREKSSSIMQQEENIVFINEDQDATENIETRLNHKHSLTGRSTTTTVKDSPTKPSLISFPELSDEVDSAEFRALIQTPKRGPKACKNSRQCGRTLVARRT